MTTKKHNISKGPPLPRATLSFSVDGMELKEINAFMKKKSMRNFSRFARKAIMTFINQKSQE